MVSKPSLRPEPARRPRLRGRQRRRGPRCRPTRPGRWTTARSPASPTRPGSTFKLVTAAAALESGLTPDTPVAAPTELQLPPARRCCTTSAAPRAARPARRRSPTRCGSPATPRSRSSAWTWATTPCATQAEAFGFDTPLNVPMGVTESRFPDEPRRAADGALGDRPVRRPRDAAADGDGLGRDRQRRRARCSRTSSQAVRSPTSRSSTQTEPDRAAARRSRPAPPRRCGT